MAQRPSNNPLPTMVPKQNPKDSLKSTWRTSKTREEWTIFHWLIERFNAYHIDLDKDVPVHDKADPVPYMSQVPQHIWIMLHAFIPLALHQAYLSLTGHETLGRFAAFNLYFAAWNLAVLREVHILRRIAHVVGFLDGDVHERDDVPDVGVPQIATSLFKTTGSRIALATLIAYDPHLSPLQTLSDPKWWAWLSLQIGLYGIVLDFFFYWYHRAMHDVSFLWKYHRTHHLTKHPNPLMSAYADHEQEFFDMVGVPIMTWATMRAMGIPMGFYEWWICHQFIAFTEVMGHSGLRVYAAPPSTLNWLLRLLDAELQIEDHDIHHRKGYRKAHNYGKQTRLWDRVFGTCGERVEVTETTIDFTKSTPLPIF